MFKYKILFSFLLVLVCFSTAQSSQAFDVKSQSAMWLDDSTFLYTITYEFGFANRDFKMPIVASSNVLSSGASEVIDLSFVQDGKIVNPNVTSNAIVLSGADIHEGKYFVPMAKKEIFTLVVIGKLSPELSREEFAGTSVVVNSLPYILINDTKATVNKLYKEKLQYYTTPAITQK